MAQGTGLNRGMSTQRFRFGPFLLDCGDRRILRDGEVVEINGRYLDALSLLVRNAGALVTKDDFMGQVWRGIPVTDEALTQAIRAIRRELGDDATRPTFIETVPKHGYRFIAPVEQASQTLTDAAIQSQWVRIGFAGSLGGAIAGAAGGLLYGLVATAQSLAPGAGSISLLAVLFSLSVMVALLGAAGVSFGIAGAERATGRPGPWSIIGGAAGGFATGAVFKLVGIDAFSLLVGEAPADVTGALEGMVLGAAIGLGSWIAALPSSRLLDRQRLALAALTGGISGLLIALLGGRLMAGSLAALVERFPESRLRLEPLGRLFHEAGFGSIGQALTATLEGALFAACVVGAMQFARSQSRGEVTRPMQPPGN